MPLYVTIALEWRAIIIANFLSQFRVFVCFFLTLLFVFVHVDVCISVFVQTYDRPANCNLCFQFITFGWQKIVQTTLGVVDRIATCFDFAINICSINKIISIYIRNNRVLLKRINKIYSLNLFFVINQRDKWRRFKTWRSCSNILETTLGRKSCVRNCVIYLFTVTLLSLKLLLLLFFFLS